VERREFIAMLASTPAVSIAGAGTDDQPSVREQIVHEIQNVYDGKVIWGEDLMRLTLAGSRVSAIESRQG
jgi:hypothetical protein